VKYEEQYDTMDPDKSRPTMTKVESMDDMWTFMWNHGAEEFFTVALFGEDALERGITPPSPPSKAKK